MRNFAPIFIPFILINALVWIFESFLQAKGFDLLFLLIANALLFVLSLAALAIHVSGLKSLNINAFIRGIYGALLLKIFIVAIIVLLYVFITKGKVNKPSLFTSMGLYFVYAFFEVKQLMKISRKKQDA
ncbi:MAG: hypothetical protein ABIO82_00120 [Ginsengibacter sp.]